MPVRTKAQAFGAKEKIDPSEKKDVLVTKITRASGSQCRAIFENQIEYDDIGLV